MAGSVENPYHAMTIGLTTVLLTLSTSSYILRLLGRRVSAVGFWWDDLVIGLALVFCLSIGACNYLGLHYGFGLHASTLPTKDVEHYTLLLFVYFQLESAAVTLIKSGILLFYWRIFVNPRFRIAVWFVAFFTWSTYFVAAFGFAFQCLPVESFWNRTITGKCINQHAFDIIASTFFLVSDIIIYVMPMPVVWNLNMSAKKKRELSVVFLIGGVVCVTGIVRLVAINEINPRDITYTNVPSSMWNMVESELGMVAANAPSLRPLLARLLGKAGSDAPTNPSYGGTNGTPSSGFARMNDYKGGSQAHATVLSKHRTGSEDDIELLDTGIIRRGIRVTTEIEQKVQGKSDNSSSMNASFE